MEYRREIDGLRAVAVLPVILFHAGVELFSGGFVGVDVFFVISGYLITSIILKEQQTGTFSLVRFYERRARRILPALFLVVIACIPFAWIWLLPEDLKSFGKSLIAVPTFTSNILFARESDYFTPLAELKPLLHTWSLAVEEQFYVFFPILLILAHKWRTVSNGVLIAAIGIISLCLAQWGLSTNPKIAFYFLPTRAWELMIGALIAVYVLRPNAKTIASHELLGCPGTRSPSGLCVRLYRSNSLSRSLRTHPDHRYRPYFPFCSSRHFCWPPAGHQSFRGIGPH